MRDSVKYLCILIVTCCCVAEWNRPMKELNLKIEIPASCSVYTSTNTSAGFTCADFGMYLDHIANKFYGDVHELIEYTTTIHCPNLYSVEGNSTSVYEYLRNANSSRNSLQLEGCEPPESGSFGEGWPKLEYLKAYNKKGLQLKREHFSGLNNLWFLQLTTWLVIPDDLFVDMPKLRIMKLNVRHAKKKWFTNLNELESLELINVSEESMDNFDTSELKSAPKFKELILIRNDFKRLTKRFFEGCSNVEKLILKDNTIKTIDFDAFERLTNLKNIELYKNHLLSLPEGLFSKNKKLEKIKIFEWSYYNNSMLMQPGFLSNLTNLREVRIFSHVISVPSDFIHGSNNLEMLDLKSNRLSTLPRDFFQNHTKLRVVKLFGNGISPFPDDYFYDKSNLTEITFTEDYL